jgi:hypothetical protein
VNLKYSRLAGRFAICRLPSNAPTPSMSMTGAFVSITRTEDELSIVCPEGDLPHNARLEMGWICFKLRGPFPFNQTGVLAAFIDPLAQSGIPIFAISTFDTDYVLVKEEFAGMARQALDAAGHELQ